MVKLNFNALVDKYGLNEALEMVLYHREGLPEQEIEQLTSIRKSISKTLDRYIKELDEVLQASRLERSTKSRRYPSR